MKNYLIATLGLLILAGCASSTATPNAESVPAVEQQAQAAAVPVVKRQDFFQDSREFLAENLKKEGVKELPGGVQYRVIETGSGANPTMEDVVDIGFTATRTDGTVAATTRSEAGTGFRSYPVKKVQPELRQVLLMMKPGGKSEVVIPPSNRNTLTDRGGALIYDLELVAVHPAAAKGS